MAIKIHELNPLDSYFEINDVRYELHAISLAKRIYIDNYFGTQEKGEEPNGIATLKEKIQNFGNFEALSEIIFYLMKDNTKFKNAKDLLEHAEKDNGLTTFKLMYVALCECVGLSEPQLNEMANEIETKKSRAMAI